MSAELDKTKKVLNHSCDFVCTDGKYIRLVPMLHFLNMDGQELALHTKCNIPEKSSNERNLTNENKNTLCQECSTIESIDNLSISLCNSPNRPF